MNPSSVEFLRLEGLPALCNALCDTEAEALAAPRGDIVLSLDAESGLIRNTAFDATVFDYSAAYENSLHFSPSFQAYADELAERLCAAHGLEGASIVEIGSGPGHFLAALCERAGATGLGFDPSFDPTRTHPVESDRIEIRAEPYPPTDPAAAAVDADFVCSRHVWEHLEEPVAVLAEVRASMGQRRDVGLYLEVPNATWILEQRAVWDVIYEHVNYFSEPALDHLLAASGFARTAGGASFGDQYLWVDAEPVEVADASPIPADQAAALSSLAADFEADVRAGIERWSAEVDALVARGGVALWGTGSKGVSFLNLVPSGAAVSAVVDINPRKHGLHVPGTGQRVVGPEDLTSEPPKSVIVMNPLYRDEIAGTLTELGINADVVCL